MDNKVVEADDLEIYGLLEVYNAKKITLIYGVVSVNLIGTVVGNSKFYLCI